MAELLHRDVTTVYQWEAGTSHPRFDDIGTVADLLEVTSDYLIRGRESDQWRR
jgi:transcriptional regulator with XRE-family HTH domain